MKKITLSLAIALITLLSSFAPTKASDESNLISTTTGLDYNRLNDLLKQAKWREANEETLNLLLLAAKRKDQGWLNPEGIQQIACEDLKTMDDLWRKYSNNRFGFSPQLSIYVATGNRPGKLTDEQAYTKFGDTVGWRDKGDWISFKGALQYDVNAPKGHLPYPRNEYEVTGSRLQYTTLTQRLVECKIGDATPAEKQPVNTPQITPENLPKGPRINLSQKSF